MCQPGRLAHRTLAWPTHVSKKNEANCAHALNVFLRVNSSSNDRSRMPAYFWRMGEQQREGISVSGGYYKRSRRQLVHNREHTYICINIWEQIDIPENEHSKDAGTEVEYTKTGFKERNYTDPLDYESNLSPALLRQTQPDSGHLSSYFWRTLLVLEGQVPGWGELFPIRTISVVMRKQFITTVDRTLLWCNWSNCHSPDEVIKLFLVRNNGWTSTRVKWRTDYCSRSYRTQSVKNRPYCAASLVTPWANDSNDFCSLEWGTPFTKCSLEWGTPFTKWRLILSTGPLYADGAILFTKNNETLRRWKKGCLMWKHGIL